MKKKSFVIFLLFFLSLNLTAKETYFYPYIVKKFEINGAMFDKYNYSLPKYLSIDLVKSSTPSLHFYAEQLTKKKLPIDLIVLPLIESGNNPQARSSKNAVGLWQFMPRTAKEWGLIPARYRDQRKNVILSTETALNYLSYLFKELGDWNLALMAYNWGIGSVRKAMKKGLFLNGIYNLDLLPSETRNYILRFHALKKLIANNSTSKSLSYYPNDTYVTPIKLYQLDEYINKNDLDISENVLKHINGFNYKSSSNSNSMFLVPTNTFKTYFSLSKINLSPNKKSLECKNSSGYHKSRYGDNFLNIAKRYGVKVDYLKDINPNIISVRPGLNIKLC